MSAIEEGVQIRRVSWLRSPWVTLALFAALSLVCYIDRFILGALLTPIKEALSLTDEQLGRLNVAFVFAYVAIVPFAGFVGDRYPRKWIALSALLLWSFASIGSGWAETYPSLLAWRALVGFGEGVFASLASSWIADTFGPKRRSVAFAILTCTSQVAAWAAYHFGGQIAAESGWSHAFFVAGIPGFILAFGLLLAREPRRGEADAAENITARAVPSVKEALRFIRKPEYVTYLAAYTIRMLAVSGLFFWGAVYLHRVYGLENRAATSFIGSAYFLTGVPGIFIGAVIAGRLARRFRGAYASWIATGEICAGIAMLFVLLVVRDLATAKWLLLLQMFFAGNSWGVINPLLFEFAPIHLRSTSVALALAVSSSGSAILGGQVIGWLSDRVGIDTALLVVPAGYFAAAILWITLVIQQRRGHRAPTTILFPESAVVAAQRT
jgi:MFS transporter, Spinster family, sphingosine-1-phosphate transporter